PEGVNERGLRCEIVSLPPTNGTIPASTRITGTDTGGPFMARRSRMVIGGGALRGVLGVLPLGAAAASGATTGPPVLTAGPVVRGSPGVGKTVRTDNGSWSTSA